MNVDCFLYFICTLGYVGEREREREREDCCVVGFVIVSVFGFLWE
jgi:hypothetical protein